MRLCRAPTGGGFFREQTARTYATLVRSSGRTSAFLLPIRLNRLIREAHAHSFPLCLSYTHTHTQTYLHNDPRTRKRIYVKCEKKGVANSGKRAYAPGWCARRSLRFVRPPFCTSFFRDLQERHEGMSPKSECAGHARPTRATCSAWQPACTGPPLWRALELEPSVSLVLRHGSAVGSSSALSARGPLPSPGKSIGAWTHREPCGRLIH